MQGRRMIVERGMKASFLLHFRSGLLESPIFTIVTLWTIVVLSMAYMLRIFERPYYVSLANTFDPPQNANETDIFKDFN